MRLNKLFKIISALAVFIACLGLFGLVSFTAERRSKEIGIRKVLGSSISKLTVLLVKDFVKIVLFANLIAWPIAYYFMDKWLMNFAFKTEIDLFVFLGTGAAVLILSLTTVSYRSIKSAMANPVDSIRID